MDTWSCTGEQSALAVASRTANGTGVTTVYSCEFLAQAPGDCIAPAHSACLMHRHPGLPGARDPQWQLRTLCVCVRVISPFHCGGVPVCVV